MAATKTVDEFKLYLSFEGYFARQASTWVLLRSALFWDLRSANWQFLIQNSVQLIRSTFKA
jgi:hypothetical protein